MSKAPWSFWLISAVALIYNGAGVANFVSQMNADSVAALPESYRALIEVRPLWATMAFAVAVIGGLLGCALLLARKSVAVYVFGVSLVGAIVTMAHTLGMMGSVDTPGGFIVGNLVQLAITAFLIWYSVRAQKKSWIS